VVLNFHVLPPELDTIPYFGIPKYRSINSHSHIHFETFATRILLQFGRLKRHHCCYIIRFPHRHIIYVYPEDGPITSRISQPSVWIS
jgi:hypothetical protein